MIPRPYQTQAIQDLRDAVRQHRGQPGLLVAPTGSGKSEIFGLMARSAVSKGLKVGAVVNRRILVKDLCKRVSRLGMEYGVIMGSEGRKPWAPVHVASFDTIWRRPFLPKWDLCFIDECHFSLAKTYSGVIKRLVDQGTTVIGMTATPIRGAGEGLGSIYKWMVRCPDTPDLMDAGFLMRPVVYGPPGNPDLKGVKKVAGEYNQKQLAQVCDKAKLIGDALKHWLPFRGRPTIGFGVDIAHCKHMAEIFCAAGVRAIAVDHTYTGDFDLVWRKLANYETEIVFNVGIAGYGWDCPPVSVMIEARPTQSLALWLQHCGRIMRTHKDKQTPVINDHAGNWLRHGLPDEPRDWTLDGPAVKPADKTPSVSTCKKSYRWPDKRHDPPRIVNGLQMPCYATFKTGPRECPYCGLPLQVEKRDIAVIEGELKEVTKTAAASPEEQEMREFFDRQREISERKGYKQGWLAMSFKARFNRWPPKGWITSKVAPPAPRAYSGDYI